MTPNTLGAVLNQVATDNGLTAAINSTLQSISIDKIVAQIAESDMHLCSRLARTYGALFKVSTGMLVFVPRGAGTTASGQPADSCTITPQDCVDFQIHEKDRPERSKSNAVFYDRGQAARTPVASATGGGGDGAPDYTHPHIFGTQTEAQNHANARKGASDRAAKTFNAQLGQGRTGAGAGGVATTQGFGDDDDMAFAIKMCVFEFGPKRNHPGSNAGRRGRSEGLAGPGRPGRGRAGKLARAAHKPITLPAGGENAASELTNVKRGFDVESRRPALRLGYCAARVRVGRGGGGRRRRRSGGARRSRPAPSSMARPTSAWAACSCGGGWPRRTEVINDLDRDVATFFQRAAAALSGLHGHAEMAADQPCGVRAAAATQRSPTGLTDLERAARFLYLQKLSFGGKVAGRTFGIDTGGLGAIRHGNQLGVTLEAIHAAPRRA